MAEPLMIPMLKNKRAELLGEITKHEDAMKALWGQIAHVDGTLRLYGYSADPNDIPARVKREGSIFGRGQLYRMVMDYCREAEGTPGYRTIAAAIIVKLGWDTSDQELKLYVAERVRAVRKRARKAADASVD